MTMTGFHLIQIATLQLLLVAIFQLKNFVASQTRMFPTTSGKVRIGYVRYTGVFFNGIDVEVWLHHGITGNQLYQKIRSVKHKGGRYHANGE